MTRFINLHGTINKSSTNGASSGTDTNTLYTCPPNVVAKIIFREVVTSISASTNGVTGSGSASSGSIMLGDLTLPIPQMSANSATTSVGRSYRSNTPFVGTPYAPNTVPEAQRFLMPSIGAPNGFFVLRSMPSGVFTAADELLIPQGAYLTAGEVLKLSAYAATNAIAHSYAVANITLRVTIIEEDM